MCPTCRGGAMKLVEWGDRDVGGGRGLANVDDESKSKISLLSTQKQEGEFVT